MQKIVRDTLRIEEVCNGFALYGNTPQGEAVFLAHLGDGVDGLPNPGDPELPEAYDFELVSPDAGLVECPQCAGQGMLYLGATCDMWAGIMAWPADVQGETCELCDGAGEVTAEEAAAYEQAAIASIAD